jgi:hypothetical protein
MNAFLAQLWKEFREGTKWLVVGLLAMAAGVVWALHSQVGLASLNYDVRYQGMSIMSSMFLTITTFGSAIVAVMIALAQTLPENRGDKWGFLTHRPVSRSMLLAAKVLSGLLIYLIATGIPLACAIWWVAVPGHLPLPFEPAMALPAIADLSCGIVYYFAAIIVGMREARWYGSRALSIGAAVICSLLLQLPHFWQAELVCAIGVTVVGTAAWGTFITGGRDAHAPIVARAASALVSFAGICIVAMIAAAIASSLLPSSPQDFKQVRYEVTGDGSLSRVVLDGNTVLQVADTNGVPNPKYQSASARTWDNLQVGVIMGQVTMVSSADRFAERYRYFQKFVPSGLGNTNFGSTHWFYLADWGLAAEYDVNSARLIGWLGPDGYTQGSNPPASRFRGPLLSDPVYSDDPILAFADGAYRINLADHHIERIFVPPTGESIRGAAQEQSNATLLITYGKDAQIDVIATGQNIYMQRRDGTPLLKHRIDVDAGDVGEVEVSRALAAPHVPTYIFFYPQWPYPPSPRIHVTQLAPDGSTQQKYSLPVQWTPTPPSLSDLILPSIVCPLFVPAMYPISQWMGNEIDIDPLPATLHWLWAAAIASALISAMLMFIQRRAYGLGNAAMVLWMALALPLGPLAVLLLRSLIELPPRERCATCGKLRLASLDHCQYCNAAMSTPKQNGTEIFEPQLIGLTS